MTHATPQLDAILGVARTVPDIEAACVFYRDTLSFVPTGPVEELAREELAVLGLATGLGRRLTLRLGPQSLLLLSFEPGGKPYPADSTSSDLWFQHCAIVVRDMAAAYDRLRAGGATAITRDGPQHLPPNTGGVTAFKFRDPYGHPLELLQFPSGVGDPAWHEPHNSGVFLGIDHTAIAVGHAPEAKRFYAATLGLMQTTTSRNAGPEQVRLDAVPHDEVDVVALAAAHAPPHLELLGYRVGTRRPLIDAEPADLARSRTIAYGDIGAITSRLAQQPRRGLWGGREAIGFADPDGHDWVVAASKVTA